MLTNRILPNSKTRQDQRGMRPFLIWGWIVILATVTVPGWADEASSEGVGLSGINDPFPTPELNLQFFSDDVPESWKDWANEFTTEMAIYLDLSEADVKAQRELITKLRMRVATMRKALDDPQAAEVHDLFYAVSQSLDSHLDLSTAILDTLEEGVQPASAEARKEAHAYLRQTTSSLKSYLMSQENGDQWIEYFEIDELSMMLANLNTPMDDIRPLLMRIHDRLENEDLSAEQLRVLRNNHFWPFRRAVAQVETLLRWEQTPPELKDLRDTLRSLSYAFTGLDKRASVENAQTLMLASDQLELLNTNAKERFVVLKTRHFGDNIHTFVAEHVFDEAINETRTETEPINEISNGARITGRSTTTTELSLDLVPNSDEARMAFLARGDIQSQAMAEKCCIKVFTTGSSQFQAQKPANFDGFRFLPFGATISVNAVNVPYAVKTPVDCLPAIGPCLDQMVLNQANAQRPQTEADIRQRIADRVVPELNREVNNRLAEVNDDLANNRYPRLRRNNLYPVSMQTATTDEHFLSRTLIRNHAEVGGSRLPKRYSEPTGVNYHFHRSLFNNIAARIDIAGRTMTDEEFRAELSRFFTDLTGETVDLTKSNGANAKPPEEKDRFVFDKTSPLSCQIRDDEIQIMIRTALIRPNGERLDSHDIMVPLKYELEGDTIAIKVDRVRILATKTNDTSDVAQTTGMRQAIGRAIPDGERSRLMTFNLQEGKSLTLRIERIKAINGWLSIWALPVDEMETETQPEMGEMARIPVPNPR